MRILIGMPDPGSLGGPAATEPAFADALRAMGHEVEEEVYVHGDSLAGTNLPARVKRVTRNALRLRRRLRAEQFDIVHLNTAFDRKAVLRDAFTLSLLNPFMREARIFLKLHGSEARLLDSGNAALRRIGRFVLERADAIGVCSTQEQASFARREVDPRKLFVVKYAVAEAGAAANTTTNAQLYADDLAARLGVESGVPLLLFISRFIPAKGLLETIRACRIVKDTGRAFALCCVGDGAERAAAEAEASALGLLAQTRFTGYIPEAEAARFYRGSTMLVFPTYHDEGFPLVVLKSVAAGLPIITTPLRGAADHLREPDNCLWVEPRDPAQLAARIIRLLDEADLRERMRRNNLELARTFTPERVAAEYVRIYREMIDRARQTKGRPEL